MKKVVVSVVSSIAAMAAGVVLGAAMTRQAYIEDKENWKAMSDKHLALFLMMNQWVKMKQEGKKIYGYFKDHDLKNIAVYGMSYVGETLVHELENTDITISYGIDKNIESVYSDIKVFSMEDELPEVDAVIVTAITFFDEIKEQLKEKIDCPVVSIEDIISGLQI